MKKQNLKYKISMVIFIIIFAYVIFDGFAIQKEVLYLYENIAPGTENKENIFSQRIRNVFQPTLTVYLPFKKIATNTAVLICPGGGYDHITIDKEGYKIAERFNEFGIAAFVLKYRLDQNIALRDAKRAIRLIRSRANEWNIDCQKVGIIGFSAGGHLAINLCRYFNRKDSLITNSIDSLSCKPDYVILVYPMLEDFTGESFIAHSMPPTFLVHADNDYTLPSERCAEFYITLRKMKVSSELHIYGDGGHGGGLGEKNSSFSNWSFQCKEWLKNLGFLNKL